MQINHFLGERNTCGQEQGLKSSSTSKLSEEEFSYKDLDVKMALNEPFQASIDRLGSSRGE